MPFSIAIVSVKRGLTSVYSAEHAEVGLRDHEVNGISRARDCNIDIAVRFITRMERVRSALLYSTSDISSSLHLLFASSHHPTRGVLPPRIR